MALNITTHKEHTICCCLCGKSEWIQDCDGAYLPTDTPTKYFKRQGWREMWGATFCSKCADEAIDIAKSNLR